MQALQQPGELAVSPHRPWKTERGPERWGCSGGACLLCSMDSLPCGESSSWKAAGAGLSNSQRLAELCLSDLRQHPEAQAKLPIHQWFSVGHGFASQRSCGNVGRDFWLAQVRRYCWHLVGRGQRCCYASCHNQDNTCTAPHPTAQPANKELSSPKC